MAALATLGALTLAGLQTPGSAAVATAEEAWNSGALTSSALRSSSPPSRSAALRRPNVLVFTADDATVSDLEHMPHVRRLLMAQGTTMTQAIAPTPICVPSRASLLTGQYAHNHGALTIEGHRGGFASFRDTNTLPSWLGRAGYHSSFAGKYLNGYGVRNPRYIPPGWDDWYGSVDWSTYDFFNTKYNHNGKVARRRQHNSDVLSDVTSDAITRRARSSRPWFAWVNFVAPHNSGKHDRGDPRGLKTTAPATRHTNAFRGLPLPRHPEMLVGGESPWGASRKVRGNPAGVREVYQQRLESLQSVDEAVGKAVRQLRLTGQLDETYVVFTSDNGYLVGHHNRVGKLLPFDRSLRIPLVVRGPGIPVGRELATPTTVPDLAVTIAAIAGVRPGRDVDGIDMLDYWRSDTTYDRIVPIEGYPVANARRRMYSGIRQGPYTYVALRDGREVLFDRSNDPGELHNVARRADYVTVLRRMRAWDRQYRDCSGASCPGPETFTVR